MVLSSSMKPARLRISHGRHSMARQTLRSFIPMDSALWIWKSRYYALKTKLNFDTTLMKRWLLLGLFCLLGNVRTQAADAFYINNGTVTFPPQIDAVNFVNNGIFSISTILPDPLFVTEPSPPFMTANTLNFTNTGSLLGTPGWQFDNGATAEGPRVWADNFVNRG